MGISKKSVLSIVTIVIMVITVLSACSSKSQNSAVSTNTPATTAAAVQSTSAAGKVHLTFLYFGNPDQQKQWAATAKAFTDSQNKIEVEYIPSVTDAYTQKILTLFASHEGPDTFYARNGETPTLLKNNKLLDLKPFLNADPTFKLSDYYNVDQINKPYMSKDGKVFAVTDNDNPMVMYYNKDLLSSLGLQDPYDLYKKNQWTWDEFTKMANKINAASTSAKPLYSFIQDARFGPNFLWSASNGVTSFYKDGKPNYEDPNVIEALQWNVDRLKDKTFLYAASGGKGMDSSQLFQTGQMGFTSAGRWVVPTFKKITTFKWDVVPFPKGPHATAYSAYTPGYTAFAINAETKHPQEAWQWFKWFVGKEGQNQNYGQGGNCVPTMKGLEQTVLDDKAFYGHPEVFLDSQKVSVWPDVEYATNPKASKTTDDAFQKVFLLQGDPQKTMVQLDTDLSNLGSN